MNDVRSRIARVRRFECGPALRNRRLSSELIVKNGPSPRGAGRL